MYPKYIDSCVAYSIIGRAKEKGIIDIINLDLRDFCADNIRVDDTPFGGGAGMVIRPDVVVNAVAHARTIAGDDSLVIFMSPRGKQLSDIGCMNLANSGSNIIIVSGHYEGVDQRAILLTDGIEVAVGDSIVSNGCLTAMYLIDGVSRYIEGVLGNLDSLKNETNSSTGKQYDLYTKPREYKGISVPSVLLSGNHKEIDKWKNSFR